MKQILTKALSTHAKDFVESSSFVKNMFKGKFVPSRIYPYSQILNEEQKDTLNDLVEPTIKFFKEVNDPAKNDKEAKVIDKVMSGLKEMGAFGLQIPTKYGGIGLNNAQYAKMVECVGLGQDMGVGITLGAHQSIGFKAILLYGTEEQKSKYFPKLASGQYIASFCLTEPASGSDAASIRTTAEPLTLPNGKKAFKLKGSKIWISNGGIADIFTVFARVIHPGNQISQDDYKTISAFIVERNFGGVTTGPPEHKMGIKASNTAEVHFEDCIVPAENLIGSLGEGFKIAVNVLNNGRFGMGAAMSGLMDACLTKSVEFARERIQFEGRKIYEYGAIQEKLARMASRKYVTEAVSYAIANTMDFGGDDYSLEAAICKVMASEYAWYVVDEAIQIHGGMGFMTSTGLERIMRDLRIFRIFEGTSEILKIFVALGGLQHVGSYLLDFRKRLTNPFKNYGSLRSDIPYLIQNYFDFRPVPQKTLFDFKKNSPSHKTLEPHGEKNLFDANFLEIYDKCSLIWIRNAQKFAQLTLRYALANGKHLKAQPFTFDEFGLIRIAECATLLYSGAVGLSRALTSGIPYEMNLMRIYMEDAEESVNSYVTAVSRNCLKLKANVPKTPANVEISGNSTRFQTMKHVSQMLVQNYDNQVPLTKHPIDL